MGHETDHANTHVTDADGIQDATASQKGLMTANQAKKNVLAVKALSKTTPLVDLSGQTSAIGWTDVTVDDATVDSTDGGSAALQCHLETTGGQVRVEVRKKGESDPDQIFMSTPATYVSALGLFLPASFTPVVGLDVDKKFQYRTVTVGSVNYDLQIKQQGVS